MERKLISRFFRKYLYRDPEIPENFKNAIFTCWEKYGINDPRCEDDLLKYDWAKKTELAFKRQLKASQMHKLVTQQLQSPIYHKERKGRGHYLRWDRPKSNIKTSFLDEP